MVKKARLFRGSLIVVTVVTVAIIYIFPRDYGTLKFLPWTADSHRWKRIPYQSNIAQRKINPILDNIEWKFQVGDDMCDSNSTLALAIVLSAVENFNQRETIRHTWAHPDLHNFTRIRTLFVLGLTKNMTVQMQIEEESVIYEDILQISVLDNYRNLTHKTAAALSWVQDWCTGLPWVVKIDDDVIVNPFNLRRFLETEMKKRPTLTEIYGRVRRNAKAWKSGKWAVKKSEYKGVFYPTFILGSAYIIGRNAVDRLLAHMPYTPFIWLEDVFTTGLVARNANVKRISMEKVYFINSYTSQLINGKVIFLVGENEKKISTIWSKITEHYKIPNLNDNG